MNQNNQQIVIINESEQPYEAALNGFAAAVAISITIAVPVVLIALIINWSS